MSSRWFRFFVVMMFAVSGFPLQAANSASKRPLSKSEIREAEQRLASLGFWTGPIDGVWDGESRHALIAFQKLQHAKATGVLTRAEYNSLLMAMPPNPRELGGPHIEVDLARQVLF